MAVAAAAKSSPRAAATAPTPENPASASQASSSAKVKDERLTNERNRLLSFAFAAAEGLIGRNIAGLIHVEFLDLFLESDRSVIRAAIKRMQAKNRMEPIVLR